MRLFQIAGVVDDAPVGVSRYGDRTWGVYVGDDLLCVTLYLKGAVAVKALVEGLQDELRQARDEKAESAVAVGDGPVAPDRQAG